jgi:hypothetical protein
MARIMRIVENILCPECRTAFAQCLRVDDNWTAKCPCCKHKWEFENEKAASFNGNRRFAGSECISQTRWFNPAEVARARKEFDGCFSSGGGIKDDGSVHFADRAEEKRFRAREDKVIGKEALIGGPGTVIE